MLQVRFFEVRRLPLTLNLAGMIAALLSTTALAQDNDAATALAPITVQGGEQQDPKGQVKGYVARTSATATKTGTSILETQQSISVMTADQIKAQGARTLSQALGYTPGVIGEPAGNDARFDSPRIRGFDSRQSQFLNGLKMMRTAGAPALELYGMERVEVLRGPASVMYGQGNPGGMINQISKRPTFDRFGEVGIQVGNFDTYGTFFDVGGPVGDSDDFAYRLTGVGRLANQQVEQLDNDRLFIAPAFTWKPDEDTSLTILTSVQHDNPGSPSGLPPALTINATGKPLGRDFFVGDKDFDHSNRNLTNLGYEFEHRFDNDWTFRQNVRYSNFDWNYQALGMSSSTGGMVGGQIRRNATFQDERLNTVNIDNNLLGEFDTGDLQHKVIVGLDYRYFDNNASTKFFQATPLDPVNPVYGIPIVLTQPPTTDTFVDTTLQQLGIYVQDELSYENWRATLGLRQDWARTDGTTYDRRPTATRPERSLDQNDHKLTGRAGLSYVFDNGIAPYVSYSTSFEPVAPTATSGPTVPTTGEQYEVGVKYQPEGWDGFFSAAVYDLRQKNVLTTIPSGGSSIPAQIGEVHVQGLELEGVMSLTDGLDLRAAYSFTDATIIGGPNGGNQLDNVPEHAASLWLDYTFKEDTALEGFGVGAGVRYIGQRYGDAANSFDMDPVTLVDAAIHYQKDGIRGSLNVANLADKKYLSTCSTFGCFYGDGISVMGRLSFSW